jgi:hypothetical protein
MVRPSLRDDPANRLELLTGLFHVLSLEFQLDAFAHMRLFDARHAQMLDRAAHRVALWIEDARPRTNNDLSSNHALKLSPHHEPCRVSCSFLGRHGPSPD